MLCCRYLYIMSNLLKAITILTAVSLIASCSTTVDANNAETESSSSAEPVEITPEPAEEPVELTYEVNTPEIINTIMTTLDESLQRQTSSGFLELREGTQGETKYQILLIETTTSPDLIYYYDTQRGFSQVTELNKNEIQYTHLLGMMGPIIRTFADNVATNDGLLEDFTFKKESPTGVYILEESIIFGTKTVYRFELVEGLISKMSLKNSASEEQVTYQYGLSRSAQKYINESFKPNQPQPVE